MLVLLAMAFGAAASPATVAGKSPVGDVLPAVSDVVAERLSFRPQSGEKVSWRYRTAVASTVTASIFDGRDLLVRVVLKGQDLPAGDHRLAWDGRDDDGRVAPPGYYVLTIESQAGGKTVRYDPTEATGGELTQASAARYDTGRGLVNYALQKPSLLRIHLGLKDDGPLLRTLVDWVARSAGEHTESWDGWDASHVIRFGDSPKLDIQVWAYALPVNAVIVDPPATTLLPAVLKSRPADSPTVTRPEFLEFPRGRPTRPKGAARAHEMYNHWQHDRTRCHNPIVGLKAVGTESRGGSGPLTVAAPLPLRLDLTPEEASSLQDERFEAVIYVDGIFEFEEEQGYLPFTWSLKPEMLTPGEHVITFMVRGYEGHFGSSSIRVLRPKGAGTPAIGR